MPSGGATRARLVAFAPIWLAMNPWWQCNLDFTHPHPQRTPDLIGPQTGDPPPVVPPYRPGDRTEVAPAEERYRAPKKDPPPLLVRDDVVVAELDKFRPSFTFCYHRAQRDDPSLGRLKVELRLYVDPSGIVMDAYADLDDRKLATCLADVARRMKFPSQKAMAMAYIALAW